jgi:hypothetical protein
LKTASFVWSPCEQLYFGVADSGRWRGACPELPSCWKRSIVDKTREFQMNGLIYLVGLVVVILAILSFFGLH